VISLSPSRTGYVGVYGRYFARAGYVSAFCSLVFFPEIFGPVAIICAAYLWRDEEWVLQAIIILVFGIAAMIVGLFFTAQIKLISYL
jgi:hypothetical protein